MRVRAGSRETDVGLLPLRQLRIRLAELDGEVPARFSPAARLRLAKYLPAITGRVVGDLATTERFLWDFRRTIGDLYADNNYGRLAESIATKTASVFRRNPTAAPSSVCQLSSRADHPMIEFNPYDRSAGAEDILSGRDVGAYDRATDYRV